MRNNIRCSVCNKVSSRDIATNPSDVTDRDFVPDPKSSLHYVCGECKEEYEQLMHYYDVKDFLKGKDLDPAEIENLLVDID